MEHLPEHPHAFITAGVVTLVAVFAEHDEQLIDAVRIANNADQALCCCNLGIVPALGWLWDGHTFSEPPQTETVVEEWLA